MGTKHACPGSTLSALTPRQSHKMKVDHHSDARILQGLTDIWKARGVCGQGFHTDTKVGSVAHTAVSGQGSHTTTTSCITTCFKRVRVERGTRRRKTRYLDN